MFYYDIHTHNKVVSDDTISIYNLTQEEIMLGASSAEKHLYFSAGIHPWQAAHQELDVRGLEICLNSYRVIAIGEIGLDKLCGVPMALQSEVFEKQIRLSLDCNLPLIIHCVKAWDQLLALHRKYKPLQPWIIHGFRGGKEQALQLTEKRFMLSIGKYYDKEALKVIYPDSILLETDDSKSKIKDVYTTVAKDLECEIHFLQNRISQNVNNLFNI